MWDFCREADINAASSLLAAARAGREAAGTLPGTLNPAVHLPPAAIVLALEAAANCSSATRQTPLHMATVAGTWACEHSAHMIRVCSNLWWMLADAISSLWLRRLPMREPFTGFVKHTLTSGAISL